MRLNQRRMIQKMTSTEKNIVRAKQIVDSWPEWKKNIQLTKYKSPKNEESREVPRRQTELECG